jgi:hypothetical protein
VKDLADLSATVLSLAGTIEIVADALNSGKELSQQQRAKMAEVLKKGSEAARTIVDAAKLRAAIASYLPPER